MVTLALFSPKPTGVSSGPLSTTRERLIESIVSWGTPDGRPCLNTSAPARRGSPSIGAPLASTIRRAESTTSGPIPSPGMRVTSVIGGQPTESLPVRDPVSGQPRRSPGGLANETPNAGGSPPQSPSDSLPARQAPARKRHVEVDQFLDDLAADLIDRGGRRRRHRGRGSMTPRSVRGSSPGSCMLVTDGFVPLVAGTPSARTGPAARPQGGSTIDPQAPHGLASPTATVGWKKSAGCRVLLVPDNPREASARPNRRERGACVHRERQVQRPARARRWGLSDAAAGSPCGRAGGRDRGGARGAAGQGGRP